MGIGGQKGVGVISGLWTWRSVRAAMVFLNADELRSGHTFTLPSIQIVKDDCEDLFVYNKFLHDTSRRCYDGHVVNMRACRGLRKELLTGVKPPTATQR